MLEEWLLSDGVIEKHGKKLLNGSIETSPMFR
jgi:hypothetical protein